MGTEIWNDILGYEGRYKISNFGRIKALYFVDRFNRQYPEKIKKTQFKKNGYEKVDLSKNGINKTFHVHRLVAQAFLGLDIQSKDCVCHKDDNPKNNNLNNLFIGSYKDNMSDMIRKGRQSTGPIHQVKNRGEKSKKATISNQDALSIKNKIREGIKLIDISREMGISYSLIKSIKLGRSWKWI